jgi:hypothetical protein
MALTYTIMSADDAAPIPPKALRELRDLLVDDDELDLGVRLTDRAPRRGEQGAIPVAVQIVAASAPLGAAFASVLKQWIRKHSLSIEFSRKGGPSYRISGVNVEEAERLIAKMTGADGAEPSE